MNKIKKISILIAGVLMFSASVVLAQGSSGYFGADTTKTTANNGTDAIVGVNGTASDTVASLSGTLVGSLLSFLGIIFMLLILVGGFNWMTAMGNEKKVKDAQGLIITAVIGLIIIFSAYAITTFVADNMFK